MRDYSFGNFISTLRERFGLSQYQLGVLVGVSDKAVSKWENGASKPRIDTIKKIAEVLDISVDELLTCEYATFDKRRKDLFAMKNEIIKLAKNELKELYGENPPVSIKNRFNTEELILKGQNPLLWMGFLGALQKEFYNENGYFGTKDAQLSSSFIAWLLGGTNVNPLPAHYRCPACKKVEFVPNEMCGIDLPDKKCSCGHYYIKDGFGVDAINMYPFCSQNEIYVSNNGTRLVKRCLQEYFKGYFELREIKIILDDNSRDLTSEEITSTIFALFSKEMVKTFPNEVVTLKLSEYWDMLDELLALMVVENSEDQTSRQDYLNTEFTKEQIQAYFDYAIESNRFKRYDNYKDLSKALSDIKNPRFSDLLILYGFMYSTGAWENNSELLYDMGVPLDKLISCREDIYAYLYNKLDGKCCKNPSGIVFEIKESMRKGIYYKRRMPAEIEKLLLECEVPEWYVESMKKIMYLFPKTYLIEMLKRNICDFEKAKRLSGH